MGVQSQIDRLSAAKAEIAEAVGEKGVDIPAGTSLSDYPDYIRQIETGYTWYGIEFDTAVSDPTCTRIGNLDFHRTLPIQNQMKGCLLNDDGEVVKYLDPNDWTGETRDGSMGQVMVELPEYYRKFEADGTKRRVLISAYPLTGYHLVGKRYVSAYEATVQRSTNRLCSVVNMGTDYRGGDNNADWDATYRTLLGRPATTLMLSSFRYYARNRKPGSTEWNCLTYDIHKELYWLAVIEYATLNLQQEPNAEKTPNGYTQGGIGEGVGFNNYESWLDYFDFNPFIPCGYTDVIGNASGQLPYTYYCPEDNYTETLMIPRYRGVENPFGHIDKLADGISVHYNPDAPIDLPYVYVCTDPSKFEDQGGVGYTHVGFAGKTSGRIKDIIFGEGGEIIPSAVGGSDTTYFCASYSAPKSSIYGNATLVGGYAFNKTNIGFARISNLRIFNWLNTQVGTRLCFIPQN